jgi:hypothetical protein
VSAPSVAPAAVALSGTGMSPVPAQFALSAQAHDYGWIPQGQSTTDFNFILRNTGGNPSAVPMIVITQLATRAGGDFARTNASSCPTALAAGASCTIAIHFAPTTAVVDPLNPPAPKTATLTVSGNPGGSVSASLSGNATVSSNGLLITPATHNFGNVMVGTTSPIFTFTVRNTLAAGGASITLTNFVKHAFIVYGFVADASKCSTPLAPGATCTIDMAYRPGGAGYLQQMGEFDGTWNDRLQTQAQATIHLEATGTP